MRISKFIDISNECFLATFGFARLQSSLGCENALA